MTDSLTSYNTAFCQLLRLKCKEVLRSKYQHMYRIIFSSTAYQISLFSLGILAFLGDIKLINIESQLFNNEMTYKFPINVKKYKKKSIAIFTENWTPEEREEQFGVLFQGRTLKNVNTTTSSERKIANSTSDWKKEDSVNNTLISLCTSLGNC